MDTGKFKLEMGKMNEYLYEMEGYRRKEFNKLESRITSLEKEIEPMLQFVEESL